MLILSRRRREEIIITAPSGERLTITVVEHDNCKARIGVTAGKEWAVNRKEIQDKLDAENGVMPGLTL